jgi:hypothetical protein
LQKAIKEMRPVLSQFESGITHTQKARLGSVVDVSADVTSTVHQLSINELSAWAQKSPVKILKREPSSQCCGPRGP